MTARPPSDAQRTARRAFMEKWAPKTDLAGLGPTYVEPECVGRQLYHKRLGIVLDYQWSAVSKVDGELVRGGRVARTAPGVGLAVGCEWGTWAERLRIVVGAGEAKR